MAEQHDAEESREDDSREPQEQAVPLDEDAAWRDIVAGYGEEPADPPGAKPFKSVEDLALLEPETNGPAGGVDTDGADGAGSGGKDGGSDKGADGPGKALGSSVSFAPGVGGGGPRDYSAAEASEDDFDADDEGHFVPPEPPPLPDAEVTAKFAWLAVIGGPLLLLLAVLLGWQMTWWLTTIGIGGFLGGFATLVMRMKSDDDEDEDPGRGAVV
ncbi:hypothetical protein [Streptomyces flavofungini]|uniref:DUF308 domain-containing protein n=1 Tax=Streptomyces flavofungini TaxID=68200 RepID=A0ABS0X2Z8_9ACTN|nr:hypothetical protein [Streptomyces flavofungini]MBJ3807421.1 hypothetical protein [Streptomyces flavofungini]GHC65648.1 hypothetical protein GCM10010349_37640 [Streptomyces flavofungini]